MVRLSPPGFGVPLPEGFSGTYLAYRDWLEDELEAIGGAVNLVGHDWGGVVVWKLAIDHPEVIDRLIALKIPHRRQWPCYGFSSGSSEREKTSLQ